MNRVLVTGGSGFIGTNLVEFLINQNYEVFNIDILPPRNITHTKYWHKGNILDKAQMERLISDLKPEYLIHLAARTDLEGKSVDEYGANTTGTENICQILCGDRHVIKKVIFASSMLVCKGGYIPKSSADYCPGTFYGESKVKCENIIRKYANELPPWAIIRPSSIWGPWFAVPYIDFFHIVISGKFIFPTHRTCTKTYGYVENSCAQILSILLASNEITKNEVFYIGDYPPIKVGEWANEIRMLVHNKGNIELPFIFIKALSFLGDMLRLLKIGFPMNSFRLKNMTTDNVLPLNNSLQIFSGPMIDRKEGTIRTLKWMGETKLFNGTK